MRETKLRWIVVLVCGLLVCGLLSAAESTRLGVVYDQVPELPGLVETTGRVLASGDLVRMLDHGAVIRLDNGRVLKLSPNTSAVFESAPDGDVAVTVLSGRIGLINRSGRTLIAGQRSTFTLSPTLEDPERAEARLLEVDLEQVSRRERGRSRVSRDR